jgi:hypothetical protein
MNTTPEVSTSSPLDNPSRMGGKAPDIAGSTSKASPMDGPKMVALHEKLTDWYDSEWNRQASNRFQQALDEDFYDGMQWTQDDAAALIERGQAPLVFNEIKPTIDWIIGTERRTRVDFKILPRDKDDVGMAEIKTKLMKYVSDANKMPWHRSAAFADAIKSGVGWLEVGIRSDGESEPLYFRCENWRNTLYDSHSTERDYSDARYFFRWKYIDSDIALALFPNRKALIEGSIKTGLSLNNQDDDGWYMNQRVTPAGEDFSNVGSSRSAQFTGSTSFSEGRERVKMIECWYKVPATVPTMRGNGPGAGGLNGRPFDPADPLHVLAVQGGLVQVYPRQLMQTRMALFTDQGMITDQVSPYHHNKIPFVPLWCFRRKRDNAPYGAIRQIRDPQEDLNKRASKSLYILSTNQVIMDKGAVDDVEELRQEIARPDAVIVKNPGKALEVNRDVQLAHEHMVLMDRDAMAIRQVSGVTDENLGRSSNATSGRAILARQDQGGTVTTEMFDNLRLAFQLIGEMQLSLVEQFYNAEKVIRLTNERGVSSWDTVNQVNPATGEMLNPITASQADFIVSEQDFRSSLRQAMFESLFDVTTKLAAMDPQIAMNMLDLVIDMADLPNKDELVARIRSLNGQRDPGKKLSPEEEQQAQLQQQEQARVKQMSDENQQLLLDEQAAKVEKLKADAAAVMAGIDTARQDIELRRQELANGSNAGAAPQDDTVQHVQAGADSALKSHEIDVRAGTDMEKAKLAAGTALTIADGRDKTAIEVARINAGAHKETAIAVAKAAPKPAAAKPAAKPAAKKP